MRPPVEFNKNGEATTWMFRITDDEYRLLVYALEQVMERSPMVDNEEDWTFLEILKNNGPYRREK